MKTSKVLLAVLGGAAAGFALGMLFAPASGTETRNRIMDGFDDMSENLKGQANDLKDRVTENFDKMKDKVKGGKAGTETGYNTGTGYERGTR